MLLSLALIFLAGLLAAALAQCIRLPRIIGLLAAGILIGPYVLDWLDSSILSISAELRQIALIIILLKAGLSLDLSDLKRIGRPAVLMAFVPACLEIAGYLCFAPLLLGISRTEAAVTGAVLSAVSPAVVVPRMIKLIEEKRGTGKRIPQMILAGASCDDVFLIVLFSSFLTMAQGGAVQISDLADIPISVICGLLLGAAAGCGLHILFEAAFRHGHPIGSSTKGIILLAAAFLLMAAESLLKGTVALSGLLAVTAAACVLKYRSDAAVSGRLSAQLGKLWVAAEILLFVLVGAAVDIRYTLTAGLPAACIIFIALIFRAAGVWLCMAGTKLNTKEKLFCVIAYLPKATVQAAIGSVPLAAGLPCGNIVLSVAVLGILLTAPLGAFGIDRTQRVLLHNDA